MPPSWDYIAKIVSIGDSGTGKSSLTIRLCEGRFQTHHDVTIGVEFGSRIMAVGPPASADLDLPTPSPRSPGPAVQKHMKLSLWDTAGQERYKGITRSYFRGASGALLVFDISRRSTFESVTSWLNDLRLIAEEGIIIVLVGNKSDLDEEGLVDVTNDAKTKRRREVSKEEAEAWAKDNDILSYVETSAKSGAGVELAFRKVAERIYQGIEAGRYNLDDRRSGVKRAGLGTGNVRMNVGLDDPRGKTGGCC
ncbi:ras-domain-containing protein [Microthyrium microscopicum]|uniref:Ras-domain-containing protein n=1 Tax=Microthyrium microscopicum TaxID=703497 RepID=A0A6A6ULN7_9PEZI|nr:ras-domain-containing protein [Microthyrium microscopicum]